MNLLCMIGLHKWRTQRVLEQTMSSGIVCFLEDDVCRRCERLRDPFNFASVYGMMAMSEGKILVHHSPYGDSRSKE